MIRLVPVKAHRVEIICDVCGQPAIFNGYQHKWILEWEHICVNTNCSNWNRPFPEKKKHGDLVEDKG